MLATPGTLPGAGAQDRYAFEMKWDGVRAVLGVGADSVTVFSRTGRDVSIAYPELAGLSARVPADSVLDGEIVAFDATGRVSFEALQPRMHVTSGAIARRLAADVPCLWMGFDVLRLGGRDLVERPYTERREILDSLGLAGECWQVPPFVPGDGAAALEASRAGRLEGVVAKLLTSRYETGRRSPAWIKVKHTRAQAVVVGGWRLGRGGLTGGLGSLLVGIPAAAGTLTYAGRVGTGLTVSARADLHARLQGLAAPTSPFGTTIPAADARDAVWVEPGLVGEVAFVEWTRDGRLRAPVWRGLRPDLAAQDVIREA